MAYNSITMEITTDGLLITILVLLSGLIVIFLGLLVFVGFAIHRSLLRLRLAAETSSEILLLAKNGITKKAALALLTKAVVKRKIKRR